MTRVVFYVKDGAPHGFEASGHTGYARAGSDIVCAAVSAILLTTLDGLTARLGIKCPVRRCDRAGYLKVTLPHALDGDVRRDAELLLSVARGGIVHIQRDHPDFVRITDRKWRK